MNRILLENYVIAWNTALRGSVQQMSPIILLRNSHPAYRGVFASQLLEDGLIDKESAKEFITILR